MTRRPNFGRLLDSFADRKGKPTSSADPRVSIRLPSLAQLLAIDEAAERAAAASRINAVRFGPVSATGMTSDVQDVADERQGTMNERSEVDKRICLPPAALVPPSSRAVLFLTLAARLAKKVSPSVSLRNNEMRVRL